MSGPACGKERNMADPDLGVSGRGLVPG